MMIKTEIKETKKETTKTIFDTPTYHRGRSLEEQQERHRAGSGHTRVGKLGCYQNIITKMIHVFQECLECSERLVVDVKLSPSDQRIGVYHLNQKNKKQLLQIIHMRSLVGNKQTSKTKLIDTILKSY